MCFCVQPTNRPTAGAKLQIFSDIRNKIAKKLRPTGVFLTYFSWISMWSHNYLRKTKNQRKPTKNQPNRLPSNRNQPSLLSIILLIINYIYLMWHEKSCRSLVGWSVGRVFANFSKLDNKTPFWNLGGTGDFGLHFGKKKSIIERNLMMDCWPNFGMCFRIAFCLVSCYLWHPVHPLLSLPA